MDWKITDAWTAKGYPGGYYTYSTTGQFTGIAASPRTSFRFAPAKVAAKIRRDAIQRRRDDRGKAPACATCGKPNPRYRTAQDCGRKRCGGR